VTLVDMDVVYQCVKRAAFVVTVLALAACGSQPRYVELPSNHGHGLDDALRRLHAVGLRSSFPTVRVPCGNGLPEINVQLPRAPARVKRGTAVALTFLPTPIPSLAVPIHHARWTYVPQLVGDEFGAASKTLHAIWPCVHVRAATASSATHMVVVAQMPAAGTRVPAYVTVRPHGYRPTTVDVTVAAR
jgi:hypothetical protein